MRHLSYPTFLIILLITSQSFAQVFCPDPENNTLLAKGPFVKTNQNKVTIAMCRYFDGEKLVGLVTAKYAQSYKFGQNLCRAPEYLEAGVRSEDVQAYVHIKDIRNNDDYPLEYWQFLAERYLEQVSEWAVACNADKKMFRRPMDIRKSK